LADRSLVRNQEQIILNLIGGKLTAQLNGKDQEWNLVKLFTNNGRLNGWIHYDECEITSAEIKINFVRK
jgi:hypothetical protein